MLLILERLIEAALYWSMVIAIATTYFILIAPFCAIPALIVVGMLISFEFGFAAPDQIPAWVGPAHLVAVASLLFIVLVAVVHEEESSR